MKIVHLYKTYAPVLGGIERHVQQLAVDQARRGFDVTVLTTSDRSRATVATLEEGVRVVRCPSLVTLRSTPISPALERRLSKLRPDIVHLQSPYPFGELAQWLAGKARATIVSYQSDIVRQRFLGALYRPQLLRFLRRADRVLVSSDAYLRSSLVLQRIAERCQVVPLGIDVERWRPADAQAVTAVRRRWPGPIVLFVGRLRQYKGVQHLIAAMRRVSTTVPGTRLLIVGRGPMREPWRRLAAAPPTNMLASRQINFLDDLSDDELVALYTAADVAVLPSDRRSEAYGLALVEAMACATPVVSTELATGTSSVNLDGETGFVVPPADPAALAQAIERLLTDDVVRQRSGQSARQRVLEHFDQRQMCDRVVEIYRQLLDKS